MASDLEMAGSEGTAKAVPGGEAGMAPEAELSPAAAREEEPQPAAKAAPSSAEPAPEAEALLAPPTVPRGWREGGVVGMRGAPSRRRAVVLGDIEGAVAACGTAQPSDRSACLAAELQARGYVVELGLATPVEVGAAERS
ncbi:MAG: hypothetical protein ACREN7_00805 [Candidatus Dormibacteria bacterium]